MSAVWRVYIVSFTAMLFNIAVADAQIRHLSRAAIDSIRSMQSAEAKKGILSFEQPRWDIGAISENDDPRKINLIFRNVSGKELSITKIATSCGCLSVDYNSNSIMPGEKSELTVTFDPQGRAGTVNNDIIVYTSLCDKQPSARISVNGNVLGADEWDFLPCRIGNLRLKRKEAVFSDIETSHKASMRIMCANVGVKPLILSAKLLPPYAEFRVEPTILEPGCEGDIVITIDCKQLPVGNEENEIISRIMIDGTEGSPSERMIKLIIKREK